jgi:hypothetical protein
MAGQARIKTSECAHGCSEPHQWLAVPYLLAVLRQHAHMGNVMRIHA